MQIFANYDSTGTIRALITVEGRKGAIAMPTPSQGTFIAEVEGLNLDDLKIKPGTLEAVEALRTIAKNHKVETGVPRCTLTKKSQEGT